MAPLASVPQRVGHGTLAQTMTVGDQLANQSSCETLQATASFQALAFPMSSQVWTASGLRQPVNMQAEDEVPQLMYPEPRAPRLGWFKGTEQSVQCSSGPAQYSGSGVSGRPDKSSSAQLQFNADLHLATLPSVPLPASRSFSRSSLPSPLQLGPAPWPTTAPVLQPSLPSLSDAPDLHQLHAVTRRRRRSQRTRTPCSVDKLQQHIAFLVACPAGSASPSLSPMSLSALPPANRATQQAEFGTLDFLLTQLGVHSQSMPPAVTPQSSEVHCPPDQIPPVSLFPTFSSNSLARSPASPQVATHAAATYPIATTKVPLVLLPPSGQHPHVPAVCVGAAATAHSQPVLPSLSTSQIALRGYDAVASPAGAAALPVSTAVTSTLNAFESLVPAPPGGIGCVMAAKPEVGEPVAQLTGGSGGDPIHVPSLPCVPFESHQLPAVLVCPPANSDTSSQHGFTPLRSCGSGALEDAVMDSPDAVNPVLASSAPAAETLSGHALDSTEYPPASLSMMDACQSDESRVRRTVLREAASATTTTSSHNEHADSAGVDALVRKGVVVGVAPCSPASPVSDTDMVST